MSGVYGGMNGSFGGPYGARAENAAPIPVKSIPSDKEFKDTSITEDRRDDASAVRTVAPEEEYNDDEGEIQSLPTRLPRLVGFADAGNAGKEVKDTVITEGQHDDASTIGTVTSEEEWRGDNSESTIPLADFEAGSAADRQPIIDYSTARWNNEERAPYHIDASGEVFDSDIAGVVDDPERLWKSHGSKRLWIAFRNR
jgi:hypothetical protein